jgi:hypothetical protein
MLAVALLFQAGKVSSGDLAIIEFESRREKVKAISNCACTHESQMLVIVSLWQ